MNPKKKRQKWSCMAVCIMVSPEVHKHRFSLNLSLRNFLTKLGVACLWLSHWAAPPVQPMGAAQLWPSAARWWLLMVTLSKTQLGSSCISLQLGMQEIRCHFVRMLWNKLKPVQVFGNVLMKKLTGTLEIVTTQRLFTTTLLLFSNCAWALERKMS